jgi:hypothetical protein
MSQRKLSTATMGNSIHIEQLKTDKLAELAGNPEGLSELIFSNEDDWEGADRVAMSNHNGWHTIHYLLAGDVWGGPWPLNFMAAVDVGTPVSYDEEYPPASLLSPAEVKEVSDALQKVTPAQLAARFNAGDENLFQVGCGVEMFESADEYLSESVVPDYEEIRNFVADAADRDRGLLVAWTMM